MLVPVEFPKLFIATETIVFSHRDLVSYRRVWNVNRGRHLGNVVIGRPRSRGFHGPLKA